jgi:hypothetical protein
MSSSSAGLGAPTLDELALFPLNTFASAGQSATSESVDAVAYTLKEALHPPHDA